MANVSTRGVVNPIDRFYKAHRSYFHRKTRERFYSLVTWNPQAKIKPATSILRPSYARVNLNMHANSILFTTNIWQAQRRRPIVTSDTDIFSTSKRHLRPSERAAYIANRYLSLFLTASNSLSSKTNRCATPSKVITALKSYWNGVVSEVRSSNSIRNRLRIDSKLGSAPDSSSLVM